MMRYRWRIALGLVLSALVILQAMGPEPALHQVEKCVPAGEGSC
jgi:hypothetical protein